jgi:histidinol-phosphate aminotransferase
MTVRVRPDVDQLPLYVPGKTVPDMIKLASNEVPGGPLPSAREAIVAASGLANLYPDNGAVELISALAARFGLPAEQFAVGNGSVTLCHQIVDALCSPGDEVLFGWRSFEMYPIVTKQVSAVPVMVPNTGSHALDLDGIVEAVTERTRVIFLCTPNNPTGTTLTQAELEGFVARVPSEVLVVVDEAYIEFASDSAATGLPLLASHDNVAVLRTFSKAYGLAGLRVGYLIASPDVVDAVNRVGSPFAVNAIAQHAAVASLAAYDEMRERCAQIVAERERVRESLLSLGFEVAESQSNFVWLPLGERSEAFAKHCYDAKIVVRPLLPGGIRVTIGDPVENDHFLAAARSFE